LGKLINQDNVVRFHCTDKAVGLEAFEKEEFTWVQRFIADKEKPIMDSLTQIEPEVEKMMAPLVRRWRRHYIGYKTTPEIALYYEQRGILLSHLMFGQDSFPGEARFGGFEFDLYRSAVGILIGWMLKHLHFARLLKRKHAELEIPNLVTVHQEIKVLAAYLSEALLVEHDAAEKALGILTLTPENKRELCMPGGAPAPLVRIGAAHVVKSVAGCLNSPFDFMVRSLRHQFPTDWDRAVQLREETFRTELYMLFPGSRFVRMGNPLRLRQGKRDLTDIDAAIFDPENGVAGIFQLKWQEPFGRSMRERESRKMNFLQEAKSWIKSTRGFLESASPRQIAGIFGLKVKEVEKIKCFRLFILGRNFSHFSGEAEPDDCAAWGLWPQVLRLAAEAYDHSNPVNGLYEALRRSSPYAKPRPEVGGFEFDVGGRHIAMDPLP
jgi:hypothetical protein